jgi:hypothetical protein
MWSRSFKVDNCNNCDCDGDDNNWLIAPPTTRTLMVNFWPFADCLPGGDHQRTREAIAPKGNSVGGDGLGTGGMELDAGKQ